MPVVPVLPAVPGLDGWTLWQKGRITAANVTWSVDAEDWLAQQNKILSPLAVVKGYNAIRLALSAGHSNTAWDDMYLLVTSSWDGTVVSDSGNSAAIAAVPRLSNGTPVADVLDGGHANSVLERGIVSQIDNILVSCATRGLGVILDVHDFYQSDWVDGSGVYHPVGPLWTGTSASGHSATALRTALVSLWTKIVQRWSPDATRWLQVWQSIDGQAADTVANYPNPVIGYELLNEPNPDPTVRFVDMSSTNPDNNWYLLADQCIKAIRAVDSQTPIVVDGLYYASAYGLQYFNPNVAGAAGLLNDYTYSGGSYTPKAAADRRIVYSFHFYSPRDFTHQGVEAGLYASMGLLYPLKTLSDSAALYTTWYDGNAALVSTTSVATFQGPAAFVYNRAADLKFWMQKALDFKTACNVPIFVGEFSAVNPALIQSDYVAPTSDVRAITKIQVDGTTGAATIILKGAPAINFAPQGVGGGNYNDFALAKIDVLNSANSAYNQGYTPVRLEDGVPSISMKANNTGGTPFQYSPGTASLGNGTTQVATLTLKPAATDAQIDASRVAYISDVLQLCISNGLSWGYWQEDGYVTTASDIDTLGTGAFVGWRPSPAMTRVLTLAATRRTVS